MKAMIVSIPLVLRATVLLVLATISGQAATTVNAQIDPPEINLGDAARLSITIQNGSASNIELPQVEGLQVTGQSTSTGITVINGSMSSTMSQVYDITPAHAGDFTIPSFPITTQDGNVVHTQPMKLHVLGSSTAPASPTLNPTPPPASGNPNPMINTTGPVIMPPANGASPDAQANGAAPANPGDSTNSTFAPPMDSDGRPAKVFVVVTPKTTDAYVGETITLRIEFYIRSDVDYQQNSLPTIKGSDFLMNDLSLRPDEQNVTLLNESYRCESWITAICAPKSGDFPLQLLRDTYWIKSTEDLTDAFGNVFGRRPTLAHEEIPSNQTIIHVHSLPDEGRPANFSGAIGQLKVTCDATPNSVAVGDPVTIHFNVTGIGNFSYVKCPTLAPDPAWKSYVPTSKTEYDDESRTQGTKTFEQALIPQKNGTLPLPAASFSYFDPSAKQYVTLPVTLPSIEVTGSAPTVAATLPAGAEDAAAVQAGASPSTDLFPNRVEMGALRASMKPAYNQPWFWVVQGGLVALLVAGGLLNFFHARPDAEDALAAQRQREHSLRQEEDAMDHAARRGDARAFFLAARHAVQLHLGAQWHLQPEAITLSEIRTHDPERAAAAEPLFAQVDEIVYSGQVADGIDLAEWDRRVREEILHLPAASS